jgi:hypothetical protein
MLDGFGLAPVTIQIDLSSYEGSWTHVQRFRGRSGWLIVAAARLESEAASWTTTAVAACDEWDNAVPAFMASNLLACACSFPQPCSDYPPDVLDSILEEEEGALITRFLRSGDQELAQLHERTRNLIERLEHSTRAFVRTGERQIAELRRRRRLIQPGAPEREVLDGVILSIEAENDAAMGKLTSRRADLRHEAHAAEELLLISTQVTVEVMPLYVVRWVDGAPSPDHGLRFPLFQEDAYSISAIQSIQAAAREDERRWREWEREIEIERQKRAAKARARRERTRMADTA